MGNRKVGEREKKQVMPEDEMEMTERCSQSTLSGEPQNREEERPKKRRKRGGWRKEADHSWGQKKISKIYTLTQSPPVGMKNKHMRLWTLSGT